MNYFEGRHGTGERGRRGGARTPRSLAALLLLSVAACGPAIIPERAPLAGDPRLWDLLRGTDEWLDLSYETTVRLSMQDGGGSESVLWRTRVLFHKPDSIRIEKRDGAGLAELLIARGSLCWSLRVRDNEYTKTDGDDVVKLIRGFTNATDPIALLLTGNDPRRLVPDGTPLGASKERWQGAEESTVLRWRSQDFTGEEPYEKSLWTGADGRLVRLTRASVGKPPSLFVDFSPLRPSAGEGGDPFHFAPPTGAVAHLPVEEEAELALMPKGKTPPAFEGTDLEGRPVSLQQFKPSVVVINFWFEACHECREELPALERLYRKYKDRGLVLLAVNSGDGIPKARHRFQEEKYTFTPAVELRDAVSRPFGVRVYPTTYVLGRDGLIVGGVVGNRPERIEALVADAINR